MATGSTRRMAPFRPNRGMNILSLIASLMLMTGSVRADEGGGLEMALRAVMANHSAISSKQASIQAKSHNADTARAQRYPTLSGQVTALNDYAQPGIIRARQSLWAFGRIDSTIAYADTDLTAEEADLIRVKRQLMDQTAVAYARMQGIRQRLGVVEEDVVSLDRLYQQIQRREQGQMASAADVQLASARLKQSRIAKERLTGEKSIAENELLALTQVPVATDQVVPERFTLLPNIVELETLAQERHADILVKRQRVALAQAEVVREGDSFMPTLSLQANHYLNQHGKADDVHVGVVLEGTLDNLGVAASSRIKAANARMQAETEDLNAIRNDLQRVVRSLYSNRQLQQGLIGSQEASVKTLTGLLESYQRQYESGYKSWLDLLNIQRERTEQRLQWVQARNDWLIYSLKLTVLIGGLDALVDLQDTTKP